MGEKPRASSVLLVLESDPLIPADLVATLLSAFPCHVAPVTSPGQIAEKLTNLNSIAAAFPELRYAEVIESGVSGCSLNWGRIFVLARGEDDEASVPALGQGMQVRPFTQDMVFAELPSVIANQARS